MHPANGTRGLRRAAFTTACAVLAQGCSTFFVHELRSQPTDELPRCTESVAAPVADMIIAGTAFVFGGLALEAALGHQASSEKPGPILPALFGEDSYHGFVARHPRHDIDALGLPMSTAVLPLPRPVLYDAWHVLGAPRAERRPLEVARGCDTRPGRSNGVHQQREATERCDGPPRG